LRGRGAAVRRQRPRCARPHHASSRLSGPAPGPRMCRIPSSRHALDAVGDAGGRPRGASARHERAVHAPLHARLAPIGGGAQTTGRSAAMQTTADRRMAERGTEPQAPLPAAPGSRCRSRPCSAMARAPRGWELELGPVLPPAMPTATPLARDPVLARFRATGRGLGWNSARPRPSRRMPNRRQRG